MVEAFDLSPYVQRFLFLLGMLFRKRNCNKMTDCILNYPAFSSDSGRAVTRHITQKSSHNRVAYTVAALGLVGQ